MKNLKVIMDKKSIDDYVLNLWSTEEFKKSHLDPDGYINKIINEFSEYPRFFADMSDEKIEKSQFYSFFNILIHRTYSNKTIQDLYYLHEIIHISTMLYYSKIDFNAWLDKMISNEMEASLESEVFVYENLDIRKKSFDFEIWYDSSEVRSLRKCRMMHPLTKIEEVLNQYDHNNIVWGKIWKDRYLTVENAMSKFYTLCHEDPALAVSECMKFIDKYSDGSILFKDEAEKFSKVYLNK
jgi:hypothetical protein